MKRSKPKVDLWGELFPMLSKNELAEFAQRIKENDSAKQKAKRGKRHLGSRKPEQKAKEINASEGLRRGYPAIRNGKEVRIRTDALTDRELLQNEKRIREEGEAMLSHADRLRAYFERRRGRNRRSPEALGMKVALPRRSSAALLLTATNRGARNYTDNAAIATSRP